jgi:hypothetical protein
MEKALIRLLKLGYDLDDFYVITINPEHYPEEITLQGHNTPEKLLKYTQLGYSFKVVGIGFQAEKNKIKINLT